MEMMRIGTKCSEYRVLYMGPHQIAATQFCATILQFHSVRYRYSIVEPDPVGSETFSGIQKKLFRIQISGQLRIRNEFEEKLLWKTEQFLENFSTKMLNLKMQIPFFP